MQEYLHRVYVPIMGRSECMKLPDGNYDKITPRMFCAGLVNGTKDSCQVRQLCAKYGTFVKLG